MTVLLGVDPGQTGALAALTGTGDLLWAEDAPDPFHGATIRTMLYGEGITLAAVEQVHAMPRQGVSSTFKFGLNYGIVLGALGALLIPYRLVTPTVWKRAARVTKDKSSSRQRATELWPNHADLFRRVKDDGRAEAALIAYWLWEQTARRAA